MQCVLRVAKRLNENTGVDKHRVENVKKVFESLVKQRYLVKVKTHSFDNDSSHQPIPSSEKFTVPYISGQFKSCVTIMHVSNL